MDDTSAPPQHTRQCVLWWPEYKYYHHPPRKGKQLQEDVRRCSWHQICMAVGSQGAPLPLWQVLSLILLGVHEREMRKEKELEVLPFHVFSACFILVLCSHCVTVDAFPFLSLDIDFMLFDEKIMRVGVVGWHFRFWIFHFVCSGCWLHHCCECGCAADVVPPVFSRRNLEFGQRASDS